MIRLCIASLLLTGCATYQVLRQQSESQSTYHLCIKLARAALAGENARAAWADTIRARGESCAPYAAEMQIEAQRSNVMLQNLNNAYVAPLGARAVGAPPPPSGAVAFLRWDYVEGTSRICVYDRLGSPVHISLPATSLCPPSMN